jgi:DNA polymerase-3 subunit epsilon
MNQPVFGRQVLVERAYHVLEEKKDKMSIAALARAAMQMNGDLPPPLLRLVEDSLIADGRFVHVGAEMWGLASWQQRVDDALSSQVFVVLDVETTGGIAGRHRIIELAAVRVCNGEEIAHFRSFVNPGQRIGKRIWQLTGISDDMISDAPTAGPVLDDFYAFVAHVPIVGHNIGSDLSFLRNEALWTKRRPLTNPTIDTVLLSARLFPDLKKPSLERLARHCGLNDAPKHRALIDARVTGQCFAKMLPQIPPEHSSSLEALLKWLESGKSDQLPAQRSAIREQIRLLPSLPGIYTFRDGDGAVLYVGKSKSLQRRVRSHLSNPDRLFDGMLERLDRIDVEVTGSEFEALLREAQVIQELQPVYNVQQQYRPMQPYVRVWRSQKSGIKVQTSSRLRPDDSAYFGPYRNRTAASWNATVARRLLGAGAELSPQDQANLVFQFLADGPDSALRHWQRRRSPAVEASLRILRRLRAHHRPLSGGFSGHTIVLIYPADPPGEIHLFFVRNGQILGQETRGPGVEEAWTKTLHDQFTHYLSLPDTAAASDTIRHFVLQWVYQHRDDPAVIPIDPACVDIAMAAASKRLTRLGAIES